MKTTLLLGALLVGSLTVFAQTNNYEKAKEKVLAKNRVQSSTATKYFYFGGKPRQTGVKSFAFTLDKFGRHLDEKTFNSRGTIETWYKKKYNEKGQLKIYTVCKPDGSPSQALDVGNKFDSTGNLIEIDYIKRDTVLSMQYNYEGGLLVEDRLYAPFYLEDKNRYIYDETGKLVKIEHYGNDRNRVKNEEVYVYNAKGQLSEVKFIGYSTMVTGIEVYKYLPNGLISEIIHYDEYDNAQFTLKMSYTFSQ